MVNIMAKNIKSISTIGNIVYFQLKSNNNISFNLIQIKKIYIIRKPVNVYYFMGMGITLIIVLISCFILPILISFISVIIYSMFFLFIIKKERHSLILIGNDNEKHVFYFHVNLKYIVVEQIKIIRGNIQKELFHNYQNNFIKDL